MYVDIGHKGTEATRRAIAKRYWWPDWNRDVAIWVRSCHAYQVRNERKVTIPVIPSVPVQPLRQFHLDCAMIVKSRGYIAYIAARCATTGFAEARMLKNLRAKTRAAFVFENIICRMGNVDMISTDNGSEFDNEILKRLLEDYNVHHIKILPYSSRAQGIVERSHRTFKEALYRSCWPGPGLWPTKFHQALWAEQITIRPTVGYSPCYLVTGHEPLLPCDAFVLTFAYTTKPMSHEGLLASRIQLLDCQRVNEAIAYQNVTQSRFKAAHKWNLKHQRTMLEEDYQPGTLVIVRISSIETSHSRKH